MSILKVNNVECSNIISESTTITVDNNLKIIGNIEFNTIASNNDVLTYTGGKWQSSPSSGKWLFTNSYNDSLNATLSRNPYIANSNKISIYGPLTTGFLHHFTGDIGKTYSIELVGQGFISPSENLVVEEAPFSEVSTGTYSTGQVMTTTACPNINDAIGKVSAQVTPTLTDSLWLYTTGAGSSLYPLSLRVEEL